MPNPSCAGAAGNRQSNLDLIRQGAITAYLPLSATNCAVSDFAAQGQALAQHGMVDFPALSSIYAGDLYFPYDLAASLGLNVANPATAADAIATAGAQGVWYWSWGNLNLPAPDGAPDPTAAHGDRGESIWESHAAGHRTNGAGRACQPGTTLGSGASCRISLRFAPMAVGPRQGSLTITDNASNAPQIVTFNGKGT